MTSAQDVDVEMIHGLAAVFAGVDDRAKALGQAFFRGDLTGEGEHMAQQRCVLLSGVGERLQMDTRNDQKMHGRLRRDIAKRDDLIVLVESRYGQLA